MKVYAAGYQEKFSDFLNSNSYMIEHILCCENFLVILGYSRMLLGQVNQPFFFLWDVTSLQSTFLGPLKMYRGAMSVTFD